MKSAVRGTESVPDPRLRLHLRAVREWEAKLTPTLTEHMRRKRKGRVGRSWYVDDAYPRAIRTELGRQVRHRMSCYLNNRLEQDHRTSKVDVDQCWP
jgi:transposase-like protein